MGLLELRDTGAAGVGRTGAGCMSPSAPAVAPGHRARVRLWGGPREVLPHLTVELRSRWNEHVRGARKRAGSHQQSSFMAHA